MDSVAGARVWKSFFDQIQNSSCFSSAPPWHIADAQPGEPRNLAGAVSAAVTIEALGKLQAARSRKPPMLRQKCNCGVNALPGTGAVLFNSPPQCNPVTSNSSSV